MSIPNIVGEAEFNTAIRKSLVGIEADCVTGPGRSGALAAVYASHILKIPFIPYGNKKPSRFKTILIIDTATETGKTLKKAEKKYPESVVMAIYKEPPRRAFWYESVKPQRYKHELQTRGSPPGYYTSVILDPKKWLDLIDPSPQIEKETT